MHNLITFAGVGVGGGVQLKLLTVNTYHEYGKICKRP